MKNERGRAVSSDRLGGSQFVHRNVDAVADRGGDHIPNPSWSNSYMHGDRPIWGAIEGELQDQVGGRHDAPRH